MDGMLYDVPLGGLREGQEQKRYTPGRRSEEDSRELPE
jgi:hypothetical protein